MKSIIQNVKECYFCKTTYNLHLHHIYFGTANRQVSDDNGFVVWLCGYHHNLSDYGVHGKNDIAKERRKELFEVCQRKYEEDHSREDFLKLIGENFL